MAVTQASEPRRSIRAWLQKQKRAEPCGPALDGVADRWSEAELRGIVANAKNWFPDTMMPAFYKTEGFIRLGNGYTGKAHEGDVAPLLTAQEIEDVVAFLMTLKEE